jgi:N-acetylglucosamine-6-phosphate deacetylase
MSSTNRATAATDNDSGSIAEGKRADLVALDGERQARLTMVGGQLRLGCRKSRRARTAVSNSTG